MGVAKDRAAPFSRKHRKYWMTVLGGMVAIAVLDVGIGMCSYKPPAPTDDTHVSAIVVELLLRVATDSS